MPQPSIDKLRESIRSVYFGSRGTIDLLLIGLLARGHVLIEDVPGVGKTVLARALARSLDCKFSRIQLTPDLLPSDVLGVSVYNSETRAFEFKHGPIFANIVVADEINRTTPRTQSAMLEAMSEEQVSVDNQTIALERPFMLVATQNPFEFEGTYRLPENQLDRFLLRIQLGYPGRDDERRVLEQQPARTRLNDLQPVMSAAELIALQDQVHLVRNDKAIVDYILDIAAATRSDEQLHLGLSPRGALALTHAAQASALLDGRDYTTPDDVKRLVIPVCGHRIISRSYVHDGSPNSTIRILEQILQRASAPA